MASEEDAVGVSVAVSCRCEQLVVVPVHYLVLGSPDFRKVTGSMSTRRQTCHERVAKRPSYGRVGPEQYDNSPALPYTDQVGVAMFDLVRLSPSRKDRLCRYR